MMNNNKILVCDDDDGILDMLSFALKIQGYHVVTEIHSVHIYEKIEKEKPALILLDLWMPQLSGEEILKTLKSNPKTQKLPVVVISASRDGAEIAKNSGADFFLEKPFNMQKLMSTIEHYVN